MKQAVEQALAAVIAPETGLAVTRMGLVRELDVDESAGRVSVVLRPTSRVCPMAFALGASIRKAILGVDGVRSASFRIEHFNRAAELEMLLNEED